MDEIINILMHRDGYEYSDAMAIYNDVKEQIMLIIEESGSYDEVEDYLLNELDLEMDYIHDFIE